jgi:hypothetical protein
VPYRKAHLEAGHIAVVLGALGYVCNDEYCGSPTIIGFSAIIGASWSLTATGSAWPRPGRNTDMQLPYHDRYAYSPIIDRPDYSWPDGKRLAVYLGLNIEHFAFGVGEGHLLTVAGAPPDPRTFAWRDYGNRVGVWRCLELFDELNLPAAHLINTAVFDYAPRIVDALKARGDEFIGHGRTNAERHSHMWEADEKRFLQEIRHAIERASGQPPRGWMAPWMASTHHTPDLLKEVGFDFLMDWPADDQPLWMKTRSGPFMSVP